MNIDPTEQAADQASGKGAFTIVFSFYSPDGNSFSMPIACLSAYIKKHFPEIRVHMAPILPLQNEEDHSVSGYVRRVFALKPDLVAVSCYTPNWGPLDAYLRALKQALPEAPILVGGYQATIDPIETIRHPAVDYACMGDGEIPLVRLISRLQEGREGTISGIFEKKPDGGVIRTEPVLTENLAETPFPDYGLFERKGSLNGLNLSNFSRPDLFILPVMSGRGCPYRCAYCSNYSIQKLYPDSGRFLRKYDASSLVESLGNLKDRYGVQFFEFWDELFIFNSLFIKEFFELYRREIRLPFSFMARVEKMDEVFCKTAAEAGCAVIWFGVECGNEDYRHRILNRGMTNRQILTAAGNARKFGIQRLTLNMVGMPFETEANMLETLALNRAIDPEFFAFFVYLPLKGTRLYDVVQESDLAIPDMAGDVLEGLRKENFRLNIRAHAGGVTNRKFQEICMQMLQFGQENNRLSL